MDENKMIIFTSFLGALGVFFLILSCVLAGNWWMLLLTVFYIFTPLPLLFAQTNDGYSSFDDYSTTSKSTDFALFIVTGIVVSTFAFPIMMARTPLGLPYIGGGICVLAELATLFIYATAGMFFTFNSEPDF